MTKAKAKPFIKVLVLIIALVACISLPFIEGYTIAEARNIVKGDTTANVKMVQTRLKELGYYTYTVDGIFGSRTKKAVKSFQKAQGLVADGIVGARTEKALGIKLNGGVSSLSNSELNLLARCVYSEARGEPYAGQVAVASVVLNRVRSSKFPNTIAGVIYQKGAFTAVSDGPINLTPNQSAYNAARDALNGWDPTNGCLYYYNPSTATSKWIWSLKVEIKIGRHNFARG